MLGIPYACAICAIVHGDGFPPPGMISWLNQPRFTSDEDSHSPSTGIRSSQASRLAARPPSLNPAMMTVLT